MPKANGILGPVAAATPPTATTGAAPAAGRAPTPADAKMKSIETPDLARLASILHFCLALTSGFQMNVAAIFGACNAMIP